MILNDPSSTYLVGDVIHPNSESYGSKDHVFRIRLNYELTGVYVDTDKYGCSRVYPTHDCFVAVFMMMREHFCEVKNLRLKE